MDLDLTGKHALVCGGSQGIGLAAAIELARLGADVTLLARTPAKLDAAVAQLPKTHDKQQHAMLAADTGELDLLRAQIESLAKRRPIHVLVNNSGGPPPGTLASATVDAFLDAYRRHLLANHVLAESVIPGMKASGYGRIVNVISTSVKQPIPGLGVSNTTRGAVASWAKTLAAEVAPFGITVNNVLPGSTHTPRIEEIIDTRARASGKSREEIYAAMTHEIPMARFAEAAEVGNAIAFLASPAASYITGINVPVDGGRTSSL
jgi:3-oxoacyl-[acyl-carrier protein] reductase